ncbi:unnamed protein product [Didymodactylos carnosus]|uniref:V-SNARE coiled-coil homology domain-containing protein n=1 Tax=Didymodactylos carnosus TaxID=1234261 RepID=A0A815FRW9_9BILA|nr:unnamed protein product [Didymodactylos carnosus]CAF4178193.1 unnamed protein product [Didymodactylos carnosus]
MTTAVSFENQTQSAKIQQLQTGVNDVVVQMEENLGHFLNRGVMLDNLDNKTGHLQSTAGDFQKTARQVKQKFWWKNVTMWIILIVIVIVLIVVIVLAVTLSN